MKEACLTPAISLLNNRQRKYALRILKLSPTNAINGLLPATLRYGDGDAQSEQYSSHNLQWTDPNDNPKAIR